MSFMPHIIRLAILVVAAVPFFAFGDEMVLWWQVGDPLDDSSLESVTVTTFHEGDKTAAELGVTDARIRVAGTDVYLPMMDLGDVGMPLPMDWYASVISPYASAEYSFVIELGNWDWNAGTWTMIATSEAASYSALVSAGHIYDWDGMTPVPPSTWQPTSYVIPEPSGGMLMLVGFALLALRRRRSGGG